MKQVLHQIFHGVIRAIKMDQEQGGLCIESVREEQSLEYSFFDPKHDNTIQNSLVLEWAQGRTLHTWQGEYLVLTQHYPNKNPDQSDILVYSVKEKKLLWDSKSTRILSIGRDCVSVPHPNFPQKALFLTLESGSTCQTFQEYASDQLNKRIHAPLIYSATSKHFTLFKKYLMQVVKHEPIGSCEYLELENMIFISYFARVGGNLCGYLMISDSSGLVKHHFNIGEKLAGIARDTFFILDNRLIFVSHTHTLNVYEI